MNAILDAWRSLEMGTQQIIYIAAIICAVAAVFFLRRRGSAVLWGILYVLEAAALAFAVDASIYYNEAPGWTLGAFMSSALAAGAFVIVIFVSVIVHLISLKKKE